jgi:excinuclease ABC subunit B
MANVIARLGRPALVLAPNKTLAAQLYTRRCREFFPENAVEYFVSYYDYYQPEAYVPSRDLYHRERLEQSTSISSRCACPTTKSRCSSDDDVDHRRARCRAIYGIGDPVDYHGMILHLRQGEKMGQREIIQRLTEMQYERNEVDFRRGVYRVRGDVIDVFPAENAENAITHYFI